MTPAYQFINLVFIRKNVAALSMFFICCMPPVFAQTNQHQTRDDSIQRVAEIDDSPGAIIQEKLKQIDGAITAEIFLSPPFLESYIRVEPESLERSNCQFMTKDRRIIKSIIDIIKKSSIKDNPDPDENWQASEAIYLKLESGRKIKFFFEEKFPTEILIRGSFDRKRIVVDSSLPEDLYRLAARFINDHRCGKFLDPYKKKKP